MSNIEPLDRQRVPVSDRETEAPPKNISDPDKRPALLRGSCDVAPGLIVAPASRRKASREQQKRACADQRSSGTSPLARRLRWRIGSIAYGIPVLSICLFW